MTGQDGSADHVVGGTGIIINDRSSYNENTDSRNSTPSRVKNVNGYRVQVKARRNVAFYIKESIPHKLRADLSMHGLESIWVEVNAPGGLSYLFCSMYRPPSASHDYYDKIVENIELASMLNKEIVIFGDFNFNYIIYESLSSNPIHLIETLFEMSQMISEPTRRTLTSSTLLDVILTSIPEKHSESRVLNTAFSDHYSLFKVIDATKSLNNNGGHKLIKFRDYKILTKMSS